MTIKAVIGVLSCAEYFDRQHRCRRTWFGDLVARDGILAFFVVGDATRFRPEVVGDVLSLPCADSYDQLPLKVHAFLRWATERFPSEYVVKCDDDTYIQPDRFLSCLNDGHEYTGKGMRGNQYAGGGGGYILSAIAARTLAAKPEPRPGPEDVWVGRALRESGIILKVDARFEPGRKIFPSPSNHVITGHPLRDDTMLEVHAAFAKKHRAS
jgi:hypothetical protein